MKRFTFSLLLSFALTATAFASDASAPPSGTWSGMLTLPKSAVLFVVTFTSDGGKLSAVTSSPYQSDTLIPVDDVSLAGGRLTFAISKLGVKYEGTVSPNAISGTFTQNGASLPLVLMPSAIGTKDLAGTWLGTLEAGGIKLLLALHVRDGANGSLNATVDSPQQNAFGVPVGNIASSNGTLTFSLSFVGASFSGKIGDDTIVGTFTQNGMNIPLTLARPGIVATAPKATPRPGESDIALQTPTGTIYGTLALPAKLPAPVVLIVAGSGPVDRDGNEGAMLQTNAYAQLAAALAKRGVASVRYDKRGVGASAKAAPAEKDLSIETYVNDVVAWVRQLNADKRFSRTIVAGHSEGSLLGILALQQTQAHAFVSLEGPGRPIGVVLEEQLKNKLPPELDKKADAVVAQLEQGKTVADTPPELAALFRLSVQPFLISVMKYDPAKEIAKLTLPVTIVQGSADVQVTMDDAGALKRSDPSAKLIVVQEMNHMLKHAPSVDGPIEPQVVDAVAAASQ